MSDADIALAEARGRRQAYQTIRAALATELRGAPYNAPGRTQLTYVGGLARARRIAERLVPGRRGRRGTTGHRVG